MTKELLNVRKEKKKKMPEFIRQDAHKRKGGRIRWRKPRGLQSKVRLELRGYKKKVKTGYRVPVAIRGTNSTGRYIKHIATVQDIESIKKDDVGIIQKVGMKRKKELIDAAIKKGITLLNGDKSFLDIVEQALKKRRERRERIKKKKESKKEKKKLTQKVEKGEEEDQKKKEKQEKEKLMTKRV